MSSLKKNKNVFLIVLTIILMTGVFSVYSYISLAPKKIIEIQPEYTGSAYEFNYLVADNLSKWTGKVVQINGKVSTITHDGILLNGTIYCQFENVNDIKSITSNQNIIIKGKLVGFDELLMEIKLNQCIIA